MAKQILSRVVSWHLVRTGGDSIARTRVIMLECGHKAFQKRSMPIPVSKVCGYCKPERAAS